MKAVIEISDLKRFRNALLKQRDVYDEMEDGIKAETGKGAMTVALDLFQVDILSECSLVPSDDE